MFKKFSHCHGVISPNDVASRDKEYLKTNTKRLNKHLQKLFGIKESIYSEHFNKKKRYKTTIFFSDQTSVILPENDVDEMDSFIQSEIDDRISNSNIPDKKLYL